MVPVKGGIGGIECPNWQEKCHFYTTYSNLTQPMDPEKKSLNFIFPTKYVIPKSLKFSHWPSKYSPCLRLGVKNATDPTLNRGIQSARWIPSAPKYP